MRTIYCVCLLAGLGGLGVGSVGAIEFTVTTDQDEVNANGLCSLREAILNANRDDQTASLDCPAGNGADIVLVPEGVFVLSLEGADENAGETGDLDIGGDLTLIGVGAQHTVIDGNGIDRVFHVQSGVTFQLEGVDIRGGQTVDDAQGGAGGGLFVDFLSRVVIRQSTILSNRAPGERGGGIFNQGELRLEHSTVAMNSTVEGPASGQRPGGGSSGGGGVVRTSGSGVGGGLYNGSGGFVVMSNCTISGNRSDGSGGGLYNRPVGNVEIVHCTFADNVSLQWFGNGVHNTFGGTIRIKNSLFSNPGFGSDCAGRLTLFGDNLDIDGSCGFGPPAFNAKIDSLLQNDGPTPTHMPLPDSPAVDGAVDCTDLGARFAIQEDQRGVMRPQGTRCDLGAVELERD